MENLLYLFLSVLLSAGRNVASKKTAIYANATSQFFLSQMLLFGTACAIFLVNGIDSLMSASATTVVFGIIYGVLLVLSQWMLTLALKYGNTSVCSVVYSLGFILPTVSGFLFWNETLTLFNLIGIVVAVVTITLAAQKSENKDKKRFGSFGPFIIVAMLSSGGLGIMQKVQQSGGAAEEKSEFLLIAFALAFCCSVIAFVLCRKKARLNLNCAAYSAVAGLCFGGTNFCNTVLAGEMKSTVFFPLQNVLVFLMSTILGIIIFHEKITRRTVMILSLGIVVIIMFSV